MLLHSFPFNAFANEETNKQIDRQIDRQIHRQLDRETFCGLDGCWTLFQSMMCGYFSVTL